MVTRALSRRIRHIRHQAKKRSEALTRPQNKLNCTKDDDDTGSDSQTKVEPKKIPLKRKGATVTSSGKQRGMIPQEEYRRHLSEMASEMAKKSPDDQHLKTLLDNMHANNQKWIATLPDAELSPILKVIPCYEIGSYVSLSPLCVIDMRSRTHQF